MLERYFVQPQTLDRIEAAWIGPAIERYVAWLAERGYADETVGRRVPVLLRFGDFAADRGVRAWEELEGLVDGFVEDCVQTHHARCRAASECTAGQDARTPVEQMLRLILPGFTGSGRSRRLAPPFERQLPQFFEYLKVERGLRPATITHYSQHLIRFEAYLERIGMADLGDLSAPVLSAFTVERHETGLGRTSIRDMCGVLRVFMRYAHRAGVVPTDLSQSVQWPQAYRLSAVPRSITWNDVRRVLDAVERRTPVGRRDYAILLLLVTYGLRAREVAALTLDDVDWKHDRLRIPERKAGHSTAFPLSSVVGEALLDYLRRGRPASPARQVFLRAMAPVEPIAGAAVSSCAARYLRKAGIQVPRPGSHTFRHTCVQRLVDGGFSFKTIGDYVGHRAPASTAIYAKVDLQALRQVALGNGEEVL